MLTELTVNFAHVSTMIMMLDIGMTELKYVKNVMQNVTLVLDHKIIVFFVLMDMLAHQLVNGSQSPNLLRLKTYQLDLPKSLIVLKDVKLVQKLKMIVYLVILTEMDTHFVHVTMDGMKLQILLVKNVVTDVLHVLMNLISVKHVME